MFFSIEIQLFIYKSENGKASTHWFFFKDSFGSKVQAWIVNVITSLIEMATLLCVQENIL